LDVVAYMWRKKDQLIDFEKSNLYLNILNNMSQAVHDITHSKNHIIYQKLKSVLLEIDKKQKVKEFSYYFESSGCLRCFKQLSPEFRDYRIYEISKTKKFTDNQIYVKFTKFVEIQTLTLSIQMTKTRKQID